MTSYDPALVGDAFAATGWRRTTRCGPDQGDCVEVNFGSSGLVAIRDTKLTDSPVLVFTAAGWDSFAHDLQRGGDRRR